MPNPDPHTCGDPIHAGMTCDEFDASLEGPAEPPVAPPQPPEWVLETS